MRCAVMSDAHANPLALKTALAEASLLPLAVFGDCDLTAPAENAERWFLTARAV